MNTAITILVTIFAIIFGFIFFNSESSTLEEQIKYKMASKPLSAFVMGGTGTAGKGIIKALLENPSFEKVTIIGRRPLDLPSVIAHPNFSKFDQKSIDFENPASYADVFKGYDVGFCALGIASVGLTNEAYYRITHDYVVDTAKKALEGGCRHYHFISGQSTSKTSWFYWARTKAQVEEEIAAMGFERVSIYRPAGIVKDKSEELTTAEKAGVCAFKVLDPFGLISVDSLLLGKAIVNNTFRVVETKSEILNNADIIKIGKGQGVK
jgi:oxidoreductase